LPSVFAGFDLRSSAFICGSQCSVYGSAQYISLGSGQLRFELFAQRHQFIDLGDDAVLFGEGGILN